MIAKPKVALSQDFLRTIAKLPSAIHSKVLKWTVQFQTHPTAPGINYENIKDALDPNLKSIRIDKDYRGIVFKPEKEDLYFLLHVDHHDEAYRWATRRQLKVHPITGALQVLLIEEVTATVASEQPTSDTPLFADVSPEDLLSFGVPEESLGTVQKLTQSTPNEPTVAAWCRCLRGTGSPCRRLYCRGCQARPGSPALGESQHHGLYCLARHRRVPLRFLCGGQ